MIVAKCREVTLGRPNSRQSLLRKVVAQRSCFGNDDDDDDDDNNDGNNNDNDVYDGKK
jgi:hypothetical protein